MQVQERTWKNILINPKFQFRLISYFVLLFILTTVSLYSTTYLFFWNLQSKAMKVGIPDGHVFYRFLDNQKHDLDLLFIGLASFNFLLLITVGFLISHRIAGPIFKVSKHLEDLSKDSEDLNFRTQDFFKELGPLVNKTKEKLK